MITTGCLLICSTFEMSHPLCNQNKDVMKSPVFNDIIYLLNDASYFYVFLHLYIYSCICQFFYQVSSLSRLDVGPRGKFLFRLIMVGYCSMKYFIRPHPSLSSLMDQVSSNLPI